MVEVTNESLPPWKDWIEIGAIEPADVPGGNVAEVKDAPGADAPLTDADLARIETCLPPIADDGDSSFAVGLLGFVGEADEPSAEFDTDDVRRLIAEVRRLRALMRDVAPYMEGMEDEVRSEEGERKVRAIQARLAAYSGSAQR